MARARNIKPSFFTNDKLAECEPLARLLFAGLWTIADRAGRLEDRPKKIRAEILPYDDFDCNNLLNQLVKYGFILRYIVDENQYIQILNFEKHQHPHMKESASTIPAPDLNHASTIPALCDSAPILKPLYPIPHTETSIDDVVIVAHRKTDFQIIYEFGSSIFPNLFPKNTSEINKWLEAGCLINDDIIPTIKAAKGKNIMSWNYFSQAIMDAKANRLKPLPEPTEYQNQSPKGSNYAPARKQTWTESGLELAEKYQRQIDEYTAQEGLEHDSEPMLRLAESLRENEQ